MSAEQNDLPAPTPRLDHGAYFGRLKDMRRMQIADSEVRWTDRARREAAPVKVLLYLGCNIMRTPFIAAQLVELFEHLAIDFEAVGGVQFCCGAPWDSLAGVRTQGGDPRQGLQVLERTMGRFSDYAPELVVMWCPSCNVRFSDKLEREEVAAPPYEITHATQFLAAMASRGELVWRKSLDLDVALHTHVGLEGDAVGRQRAASDRAAALELIEAVPGVRVVAELRSPAGMDYDCGPAIGALARDEFMAMRDAMVDEAYQAGAQRIVSISHACHREWSGRLPAQAPRVVNYIHIVAEALGLPPRADTLRDLHGADGLDALVEVARPAWAANGMNEEQARRVLRAYVIDGAFSP
jgi:Fe-S oxidoreductase